MKKWKSSRDKQIYMPDQNPEFELVRIGANLVKNASYAVAFTGAGISVESGVPSFRGENGLWNRIDPSFLELENFKKNPKKSWNLIIELFYNHFEHAEPNEAHYGLAQMEKNGLIKTVITQNIDNLHQASGSTHVLEFHGNTKRLVCLSCGLRTSTEEINLEFLPPYCSDCGGLLKPDITFFGEAIPEPANTLAFEEARRCDLLIIIGSTGEVYPAAFIPEVAKESGAKILEVNVDTTNYTAHLTDLFIRGKAGRVLKLMTNLLGVETINL